MNPVMQRQAKVEPAVITREMMDKVIRRSFRALDPKPGNDKGELYYDLSVEEVGDAVIRVYTSIGSGGTSFGVGDDAIRVGIFAGGRPLKAGKMPIVKRIQKRDEKTGVVTQLWPDNLRTRIEDAIEEIESLGEERARAQDLAKQQVQQQVQQQQAPDAFRAERKRQGLMLEDLADAEAAGKFRNVAPGTRGPFSQMLDKMLANRNMLLSEKQLAWAEREHRQLR